MRRPAHPRRRARRRRSRRRRPRPASRRLPARGRRGRDHADVGDPVDAGAEAGPGRRDVSTASAVPRGVRAQRRASANDFTVQRVVSGLRPARATATASAGHGARARSAVHDRAAPTNASASRSVRDLRRRRRDARPERRAGLQPLRGLRAHGGRAQRLQRQPRRHDLLGQRGRRRARARTVAAEVAEVPARARRAGPAALRAAAGLYSHWDDHEFINDFSRPEHGEAIYRAGVEAFRDYAPVDVLSRRRGLYRTFRWGKHLELFFLDERSFRSAKATAGVRGRPRADRAAGRAQRVCRARSRARATRSRRPASTRSTIRRGRCSAPASTRRSRGRSAPRPRPGRWS